MRSTIKRPSKRILLVRPIRAAERGSRGAARVPTALLAPYVAFPALWILALGLAQIHVLAVQRAWSATAWVVMLAVPAAFVAGGLGARAIVSARMAGRRVLRRTAFSLEGAS